MLYFLISCILFFTSAQSNSDKINAYYSPFTGKFIDNPESILILADKIRIGSLINLDYYQNIPKKLIELGFIVPDSIPFFENLISEILSLANDCYNSETTFSPISSASQYNIESYVEKLRSLINKKYDFYKKLNLFYDTLRDYFLKNYMTLGVKTLPEAPEEINQDFMIFLIENHLNLLTPPRLSLEINYVLLLLNLKDKNIIIDQILRALTPYIPTHKQEFFRQKLDSLFEGRDLFLYFPINETTDHLDNAIKDYFENLSTLLNMNTSLQKDEVKFILDNHRLHFPNFSKT